ncbi:MAG: VOC family protein [Rhizobiaceae bacterium]
MQSSRKLSPALDGILETAIYAEDLDVARAFYGGILGLEEVTAKEGRHVFFRCGKTMVLVFNPNETVKQPFDGGRSNSPHGTKGATHVCFSAPKGAIEAWTAHLQENDIAIESEITWKNGARSVYFRDPAGNSLEFAEPKLWGYGPDESTE